jgi:K+-transporting ATPase, c chain
MTFLRRTLLPAVLMLVVLTVITGVVYPVAVWAVGQVAFPSQANGSLIVRDGGRVEPHRPGVLRPEVLHGATVGGRQQRV